MTNHVIYFVVKQCLIPLSFFELTFNSFMIFGGKKVPVVSNSVFVRRPNNLWTDDDPILG